MTSADAVFAIAELLECILSYCSTKEVLLSQGVNTRWRSLIQHSPRLQRRLFLLPSSHASEKWKLCETILRTNRTADAPAWFNRDRNQTLSQHQSLYLTSRTVLGRIPSELPVSGIAVTPVFVNPLLADPEAQHLSLDERASRPTRLLMRLGPDDFTRDSARSWQAMYLTQPPCTHVDCQLLMKEKSPPEPVKNGTSLNFKVASSSGVRVQDIVGFSKKYWNVSRSLVKSFEYDFVIQVPRTIQAEDADFEEVRRRTTQRQVSLAEGVT